MDQLEMLSQLAQIVTVVSHKWPIVKADYRTISGFHEFVEELQAEAIEPAKTELSP